MIFVNIRGGFAGEVLRKVRCEKIEPFGAYVMLRNATVLDEPDEPEEPWTYNQAFTGADMLVAGPNDWTAWTFEREPGEVGYRA